MFKEHLNKSCLLFHQETASSSRFSDYFSSDFFFLWLRLVRFHLTHWLYSFSILIRGWTGHSTNFFTLIHFHKRGLFPSDCTAWSLRFTIMFICLFLSVFILNFSRLYRWFQLTISAACICKSCLLLLMLGSEATQDLRFVLRSKFHAGSFETAKGRWDLVTICLWIIYVSALPRNTSVGSRIIKKSLGSEM